MEGKSQRFLPLAESVDLAANDETSCWGSATLVGTHPLAKVGNLFLGAWGAEENLLMEVEAGGLP